MHLIRTSTVITLSVWKALFLREAVTRIFSGPATWLWLLIEPMFNVFYLVIIFTVIRVTTVGGIDTVIWLLVGMLGFFMFRRTATQVMNGINANKGLFAYRQVKPIDTVLVRGGLEGFLMIIISSILLVSVALFGHSVMPENILAVLEAFFGLWLIGLSFGLITSVISELLPELAKVINLIMTPMYIISGVIFPISSVAPPYRDWLMLNPVADGLEAIRLGFAPYYHAAPEMSIAYIYEFALVGIFLGLSLHRRFALRLTTQ